MTGCNCCTDGYRSAIQRIRRGDEVEVRERKVACGCELGLHRVVVQKILCWTVVQALCPDAPDRKLYVTGTAKRAIQADADPSSPWYTCPSPEEVYGPTEGARLRAVGMRQQERATALKEARALVRRTRMFASSVWTEESIRRATEKVEEGP